MRILVTGATGFIGSHLIPLLLEHGHEVIGVFRHTVGTAASPMIRADLNSGEAVTRLMESSRPDALVHLAWEGLPDYSYAMSRRNLDASLRLFEAANRAEVDHIVSSGSCWEYAAPTGKTAEDAPLAHDAPFQAAKNAAFFMGNGLATASDSRFHWLRLFFVYGPGQRHRSLLPHVVDTLSRGEQPDIRSPQAMQDFIHVSDVARAFAMVLDTPPPNGAYNVGSGEATAVWRMAETARKALGISAPLYDPIPVETDHDPFRADCTRLGEATGWHPELNLENGIAHYVKQRRHTS